MKKCFSLVLFVQLNLAMACPSDITIRAPQQNDLPALIELDRAVSYEYFRPLYITDYAHFPLGQNPDYFLELELEADKHWFARCIEDKTNDYFLIDYDNKKSTIVGLIIVNQVTSNILQIKLFLVAKEYRRHGLGRALFYAALDQFKSVSTCVVYPLNAPSNEPTVAFYRSLGFENRGPANFDKINIYGIAYSDMYYYFALDLPARDAYKGYHAEDDLFAADKKDVFVKAGRY